MAFSDTPTDWIANWSEDGTDISVPLTDFPELTAAEADGATGDIRKIMFAVAHKFYDAWNDTAVADRPNRMTLSKSISTNVTTGIATNTFTFRFENESTGSEVADEEA
jgi:hypothetical protein